MSWIELKEILKRNRDGARMLTSTKDKGQRARRSPNKYVNNALFETPSVTHYYLCHACRYPGGLMWAALFITQQTSVPPGYTAATQLLPHTVLFPHFKTFASLQEKKTICQLRPILVTKTVSYCQLNSMNFLTMALIFI